jgi:hypothetical protein
MNRDRERRRKTEKGDLPSAIKKEIGTEKKNGGRVGRGI